MRIRTPLGRLPASRIVAANVLFWPAWTAAVGYAVQRVPAERFAADSALTRLRGWEDDGRWYERVARIRRWKERLPEAGAAFEGGFAKRSVAGGDRMTMERFVVETRRAEMAHWAMTAGVVATVAWNPWWALPVNAAVAVGSNAPCLAVQRYNRARLLRVLARRGSEPRQGR